MRGPSFRLLAAALGVAVGICIFPAEANGQSRESARSAVERQAQTMSPEERRQKLQEMGMTEEEAKRLAASMGIDLDEYLSKIPASQKAPEYEEIGPAQEIPPDTLWKRIEQLPPMPPRPVPGFTGRHGVDTLIQPFGFEIFRAPSFAFRSSELVATPPSYALGPGDEVLVSLWGQTQLNYRLTVNRDGDLVVPDVGPVSARGATVEQLRERMLRRMSTIYSGLRDGDPAANTFLDVSLGKLKTIRILVMGEVRRPGAYPLASMSTALQALYAAGGPQLEGSLRGVRILRNKRAVSEVDLYGFILGQEMEGMRPLEDGDVVYVPPAQRRAAVVGEIIRPAIYELRGNETLGALVRLAGGLRFSSYDDRIHIERIIPFDQRKDPTRSVMDFDVSFSSVKDLMESQMVIEDGDVVTFFPIVPSPLNRVAIAGNVYKPGYFELKPGMQVRDLILAADSLRRNTFPDRGTIYRLLPTLRREILAFSPRLALEGDARHNLLLQNEDSVEVYPDSIFIPRRTVTIAGAVRNPGEFDRDEQMTVADLVVLAGGLLDGASLAEWEIARLDTSELGVYRTVFKTDAGGEYWMNRGEVALLLEDYDAVFIPFNPKFSTGRNVQVSGYVMFPGTYTLQNERETVADIISRAGGLRAGAYLEASRLYRKYENAGLVPIDFRTALANPSSPENVVLYDGDSVHVSRTEQVIYVNGEVYVPSPVIYLAGASLDYYIYQAGGFTQDAEEGRTVVFLPGGKKWEEGDIPPGSRIFVPTEIEKEDKVLPLIRDSVAILASLAAITVSLVVISQQ